MKVETKLAIIGAIAFVASVVLFFVSDASANAKGWFADVLDIFMATMLIFVLLSVNFFAFSFLIRLIRKRF